MVKEKLKKISKKVLLSYRALPDKKQYIEFFTAVLSVPVLITVILLNLNSLTGLKNTKTVITPTQAPQTIYINTPTTSSGKQVTANTTPTQVLPSFTQGPCKPQIGPIAISSPQEGQTVLDNPVAINISYQASDYCSVVWSYRINGGTWSEFDNKSIALYNLPRGVIQFDLRVQSTVTDQQQNLSRRFMYNGGSAPTTSATITPQNTNASSSAKLAN